MAKEKFALDESDFEDAIMEIAQEIDLINAIKKAEPQKVDPQIILKVEMELKKAKSSSTRIFQILKTLQESQIHTGYEHSDSQVTPSPIERKYILHKKGFDQKYHPMTITETIIGHDEISDYQNITIEDLFEDPGPEENPSVVVSIKKKQPEKSSIIPDSDNQHQLQYANNHPDKTTIKTIHIPNTITKNMTRQLKDNEKALFKNLMKMQRK